MKVIFLDIDGVINSQEIADQIGWGGHFDESEKATHENVKWQKKSVDYIKKIVEQTGAQIVISSTWRKFFSIDKFKEMFSIYGWEDAPIIDKTPGGYRNRGLEVNAWIADNPIENYVILDDYSDFLPDQFSHFVNTDPEIGLTEEDADKAIEILKYQSYEPIS